MKLPGFFSELKQPVDLVNHVTNCLRHTSVAAKNFREHLCHTFFIEGRSLCHHVIVSDHLTRSGVEFKLSYQYHRYVRLPVCPFNILNIIKEL